MAELEKETPPGNVNTPQLIDHRDKPPSVWRLVVMAADCSICDCCEEPWCDICHEHYADCDCPGPHQDDIYEYREYFGALYAREKADGTARQTH